MTKRPENLSPAKAAYLTSLAAAFAAGNPEALAQIVAEAVAILAPYKADADAAWTNRREDESASNRASYQVDMIREDIAQAIQDGARPAAPEANPPTNANALALWQLAQATKRPEDAERAAFALLKMPPFTQVQELAEILKRTVAESNGDDYAQTLRFLVKYYELRAAQAAPLLAIAQKFDEGDPTKRIDLTLADRLRSERYTNRPADKASQLEREAIRTGAADCLFSADLRATKEILEVIAEEAQTCPLRFERLKESQPVKDMERALKAQRDQITNRLQSNEGPEGRAIAALFEVYPRYQAALRGDKYSHPAKSEVWLAYRKERALIEMERDAKNASHWENWRAAAQATATILLADRDGIKAPTLTSLADAFGKSARDKKEIIDNIKAKLARYGATYAHGRLIWSLGE